MHIPQSTQARLALQIIMTDLGKNQFFSNFDSLKKEKGACFVSLHIDNDGEEILRGCIGTLLPVKESLYDEIASNARSAAFHDPRFSPLQEEELPDLTVSVDILDEPEFIDSPDKLDPVEYGVIVETDHRRGVLLPNLPGVESVDQQLSIARNKSGIRESEPVQLYRFKVVRYH